MEKFGSGIRDGQNSDPGWKKFESGIGKIRIRDGKNSNPGSGMEKFGSGIRDKRPGSATLILILNYGKARFPLFQI
jgi:hypothetical protein